MPRTILAGSLGGILYAIVTTRAVRNSVKAVSCLLSKYNYI